MPFSLAGPSTAFQIVIAFQPCWASQCLELSSRQQHQPPPPWLTQVETNTVHPVAALLLTNGLTFLYRLQQTELLLDQQCLNVRTAKINLKSPVLTPCKPKVTLPNPANPKTPTTTLTNPKSPTANLANPKSPTATLANPKSPTLTPRNPFCRECSTLPVQVEAEGAADAGSGQVEGSNPDLKTAKIYSPILNPCTPSCHQFVTCTCRLKLRELLMPEVVSQVEGSNPNVKTAKKNGGYRSWKVNPDLFPCELPKEVQKEADDAVQVRGFRPGHQ